MLPSYTTLSSMLDEIQLPPGSQAVANLDVLAQDFANWISHSNPVVSSSKFGLLCTSEFQAIAGRVLEYSFIKDFRLLIWTTSLAHTAHTANYVGTQRPDEALNNLRKLRNSYGAKVIRTIDSLCRPLVLQRLSTAQRKLLFLIIFGICLSATYTRDNDEILVFKNFLLKNIRRPLCSY